MSPPRFFSPPFSKFSPLSSRDTVNPSLDACCPEGATFPAHRRGKSVIPYKSIFRYTPMKGPGPHDAPPYAGPLWGRANPCPWQRAKGQMKKRPKSPLEEEKTLNSSSGITPSRRILGGEPDTSRTVLPAHRQSSRRRESPPGSFPGTERLLLPLRCWVVRRGWRWFR